MKVFGKILTNRNRAIAFYSTTAALFLLGISWFFGVRVGEYYQWPPEVYSDPRVFNLTKNNVVWDVYYGPQVSCGAIDCHLLPETPSSQFTKQMVLPAREFPLRDYQKGQLIYARTTISVPEFLLYSNEVIVFHSLYVFAEKYEAYFNGRLLESGGEELLNVTLPPDLIGADHKLTIVFKIDPGSLPYQGIANRGDLAIGPKSILQETKYLARDLTTTAYLWFLLPKLTLTVMFIFFYLFWSRGFDIFSFVLFAFFDCVSLFLRSGYAAKMLKAEANYEFMSIIASVYVYAFLALFVAAFFRKRESTPYTYIKIFLVGYTLLSIACLTVIPYQKAYSLIDMVIVLLKPVVIAYACYTSLQTYRAMIKTGLASPRANFSLILFVFFSLFMVVILADSTFVLLDHFGINLKQMLRFGRIFELLFFFALAAITVLEVGYELSAKQRIEAELRTMEERLELGKSVQDLLLPKHMAGTFSDYQYRYFYEPAEKMSGDWVYIWNYSADEIRLFIGDVVGKGPQAALGVATITSIINECRYENCNMPTTIERLNSRLVDLFQKRISTTMSAAVLNRKGELELFNCGAMGWITLVGDQFKFLGLRGSPLGVSEKTNFAHLKVNLPHNGLIISFTDGCLEGSRALKTLSTALKELSLSDLADLQIVRDLIIRIGAEYVHTDDKTVLFVKAS